MSKHLIIPDTQVKQGVPLDHLTWAGKWAAEKKPDVIVHIGDFADMPSLSSYDVGKKAFEGRTYAADVEAAKLGMSMFMAPIEEEQARQRKNKEKVWKPRKVLTLGNHEHRIDKAINNDRKLEGLISTDDLGYKEWGWEVYPFLEPVKIDGVMYCFTPEQHVLHSDWQYRPLKDLQVGDSLVGFDENANVNRQYRQAKVTGVEFDTAEVYSVSDSSATCTRVTADHLWLVRPYGTKYVWVKTSDLKPGYEILKPFEYWKRSTDLDMAWLGGIFDGEGWLSKPNTDQGGIQIGFSQNEGIVLDKALSILAKNGYTFSLRDNNNDVFSTCKNVTIQGTLRTKIKLLVELNAIRLLNKLDEKMLGRLQSTGINPTVTEVSPIGKKEIIKVATSTGTLIVGGYAHHNCHYFTSGVLGRPVSTAAALLNKKHISCVAGHQQGKQISTAERADGKRLTGIIAGSYYQHDEDYLYNQGNKHWRGIIALHEVEDGQCDELFISLEYLRKKYGNP